MTIKIEYSYLLTFPMPEGGAPHPLSSGFFFRTNEWQN